jgi:tRNA nucleotidyltransferase (CCA-adding enzyme)
MINEYDLTSYGRLLQLDREGKLPPQLAALKGVQQSPDWHPEGDVWTHTTLVVRWLEGATSDMVVRLAGVCHDLGKPQVTELIDGRWKAHGHDVAGEGPTRALLNTPPLSAGPVMTEMIVALVVNHMTPQSLIQAGAGLKAFRRLDRKLKEANTDMERLGMLLRGDYLGRGNDEAKKGRAPIADQFEQKRQEMIVADIDEPAPPVVLGRHLIARGFKPGPQFGPILNECRRVQEYLELTDADEILNAVLNYAD